MLDAAETQELSHRISDPSTDKLVDALKVLDRIEEQKAKLEARELVKEQSLLSERISDVIAEFTGSVKFIVIHIIAFSAWIVLNLLPQLFGIDAFDPFPFMFLTLAVSLEAIFLSTFILISQNRQSSRDRRRDEIDFERDRLDLKVDTLAAETIREATVRIRGIEHEMRELNKQLAAHQTWREKSAATHSDTRQTSGSARSRKRTYGTTAGDETTASGTTHYEARRPTMSDQFERMTDREMKLIDKAEAKVKGELNREERKENGGDSLIHALSLIDHLEQKKNHLEMRAKEREEARMADKIASWITRFAGSIPFFIVHVAWFGTWIAYNEIAPASGLPAFDPFPYLFLTLTVSLEAIMLSTFILITQNRQSRQDRMRDEIDLERDMLDLKVDTVNAMNTREASLRIARIEHKLDTLTAAIELHEQASEERHKKHQSVLRKSSGSVPSKTSHGRK
jgi:uncharacterized membrane protein